VLDRRKSEDTTDTINPSSNSNNTTKTAIENRNRKPSTATTAATSTHIKRRIENGFIFINHPHPPHPHQVIDRKNKQKQSSSSSSSNIDNHEAIASVNRTPPELLYRIVRSFTKEIIIVSVFGLVSKTASAAISTTKTQHGHRHHRSTSSQDNGARLPNKPNDIASRPTSTTQHNATQRNTTQHNTTSITQHNATCRRGRQQRANRGQDRQRAAATPPPPPPAPPPAASRWSRPSPTTMFSSEGGRAATSIPATSTFESWWRTSWTNFGCWKMATARKRRASCG